MSETSEIAVRVAPDRAMAEEWALVLVAEGLSPKVRSARDGFVLGVPAEEAERAAAALFAYERENPAEPQDEEVPVGSAHMWMGFAVATALVAFFFVVGGRNPAAQWFMRGSADAERILLGELWRTVTALTLHADFGHVAANAIAIALLLSAVCRALGPGLGFALVLLAGVGGNIVNAVLHGSLHVSVGASTAVFGAIGVLGGLAVVRRRRKGARGRHAWMPVAAGLALLAMLGMGEQVDLWAHLWGFVVGGMLGILVAFAVPGRPAARVQWALGGSALAVVVYCWALALA
ncbi:MAG: rhomboid family intramembrane serine protease [Candidatus Methylomirabilales bacterium]